MGSWVLLSEDGGFSLYIYILVIDAVILCLLFSTDYIMYVYILMYIYIWGTLIIGCLILRIVLHRWSLRSFNCDPCPEC